MYGVVLLAALAPAADPSPAPAETPMVVAGCVGCLGCDGVVVGGCVGCYGCTGCYGCSGCYGCHGGLLGWLHAKKAAKRAYRGYLVADGGYSCLGACYGCYGTAYLTTPWACHGGCYGGYYGIGSAYGPSVIMVPTVWGHRTTGGWGYAPPTIYGAPYAIYGHTTVPEAPTPSTPDKPKPVEPKPTEPKPTDKPADKKEEGKKISANLKFVLPAEAKLYVDGRLTTQEGSERLFSTPPLAPGQLYYYDVTAELTVAGQVVSERKRVIVHAGAEITETFGKLFAAIEGRTVPVAGK
ncbi:MAG: TIGR03000 domain-containing protein [Gemmataceae bacterium]|nr:TIGR03000 domain-containing protein [Gemmataceae bacterium]MDW8242393.1 TIGR03000 domain-containing protein [Thermogemmata sp.]